MSEFDQQETVIRDKRRIDPETGELRTPVYDEAQAAAPHEPVDAATGTPGYAQTSGDLRADDLELQLIERTNDLQRVKAEFDNYRRRIERDRQATADLALATVLANLLPVLDDIGRAREHGELEGGFKSVAEALEGVTVKLGLTPFGEPGDPFDPAHHDALMHSYSDDVSESTAVQILQPGYSYAGRIVRPARVAVAEPTAQLSESEVESDDVAPPSE